MADAQMTTAVGLEARYRARSLWLDGIPEPLTPRPSLPGDVDCDVAIVGAGFTGLWSAYYLKQLRPDLRVVVLEREIAGYGPAGRNGGWAGSGIAGSPKAYGHSIGDDAILRGSGRPARRLTRSAASRRPRRSSAATGRPGR